MFQVMWIWFYQSHRLPKSFARWISEVAQIDDRLRDLLVMAREGRWTYGKPLSETDGKLMRDLAAAHGLDASLVDPAKVILLSAFCRKLMRFRSIKSPVPWYMVR